MTYMMLLNSRSLVVQLVCDTNCCLTGIEVASGAFGHAKQIESKAQQARPADAPPTPTQVSIDRPSVINRCP
jgi:hypothetical protein